VHADKRTLAGKSSQRLLTEQWEDLQAQWDATDNATIFSPRCQRITAEEIEKKKIEAQNFMWDNASSSDSKIAEKEVARP
jgi:hypothetical protein